MQTVTSTSGTKVNGAFLQEVKDGNVELWQAVEELRVLVHAPGEPQTASRKLVSLLGRLRDCLALQFSLEESYGYVRFCPGVDGGTSARTLLAQRQHRELYLRIHELCEQAEEAQYRGTAERELNELLSLTNEFDDRLRAHECLETDLIVESLGGGFREQSADLVDRGQNSRHLGQGLTGKSSAREIRGGR